MISKADFVAKSTKNSSLQAPFHFKMVFMLDGRGSEVHSSSAIIPFTSSIIQIEFLDTKIKLGVCLKVLRVRVREVFEALVANCR